MLAVLCHVGHHVDYNRSSSFYWHSKKMCSQFFLPELLCFLQICGQWLDVEKLNIFWWGCMTILIRLVATKWWSLNCEAMSDSIMKNIYHWSWDIQEAWISGIWHSWMCYPLGGQELFQIVFGFDSWKIFFRTQPQVSSTLYFLTLSWELFCYVPKTSAFSLNSCLI